MNDTNLIIAIAKLDGRENAVNTCLDLDGHLDPPRMPELHYLTSRDAIIPVIENWVKEPNIYGVIVNSEEKMIKFISCLYDEFISPEGIDLTDVYGNKYNLITFVMLTATPKQLAIALREATGNWTEGE